MAHTMTDLIPTIIAALDVVSRELIGFIPAVSMNAEVTRAAKDQTVKAPVAPAAAAADSTPGVTAPDTGDQVIGNVEVTISKSRHVPVRWNGEQTLASKNAGFYGSILQQQFEQAFRTLANEIEADLAALYYKASRAYGASGTTPFASAGDFTHFSNVAKILDDNGCPRSDRQLVLGTAAMANLRGKQSSLFKVNEAGTESMLREGVFNMIQGFAIRDSNQVKVHTPGTAANYLVDLLAGYAAGTQTVHIDTGTGTHLLGDVISFEDDAEKYVIGTSVAGDGDKDIVLNKPGLRSALADGKTVTTNAAYTANMAFHRSALVLAARLPAMPEGGDAADDAITVTDPVSGISFEIAKYRQFMQVHYQVRAAWGVAAVKSEHMALLLG